MTIYICMYLSILSSGFFPLTRFLGCMGLCYCKGWGGRTQACSHVARVGKQLSCWDGHSSTHWIWEAHSSLQDLHPLFLMQCNICNKVCFFSGHCIYGEMTKLALLYLCSWCSKVSTVLLAMLCLEQSLDLKQLGREDVQTRNLEVGISCSPTYD